MNWKTHRRQRLAMALKQKSEPVPVLREYWCTLALEADSLAGEGVVVDPEGLAGIMESVLGRIDGMVLLAGGGRAGETMENVVTVPYEPTLERVARDLALAFASTTLGQAEPPFGRLSIGLESVSGGACVEYSGDMKELLDEVLEEADA